MAKAIKGIALIWLTMASAVAQDASDPKAIEIADQVMTALGGRENYDNTRYLTWRFFGRRLHVWDKWTGNIRYEDGKGAIILMNINTKQGKVWQDGEPVVEEAALQEKLEQGYRAWINDSYWLVMPYKLRDPGVTLTYVREDKTEDGRPADVLSLTFDNVGVTPNNKYEVYVDKETRLVTAWSFFTNAGDEAPRFKLPWSNWKSYGTIMLADSFGERGHKDVAAFSELPAAVFEKPDPPALPIGK